MNIHWKDIKDSDIVTEDKFGWTVGERDVHWFTHESEDAHAWLKRRAKVDVLREKNRTRDMSPWDADAEPPLL